MLPLFTVICKILLLVFPRVLQIEKNWVIMMTEKPEGRQDHRASKAE
jgi:hypothetical protein